MIRALAAILFLDLKRFWLDRARMVAGLVQPLLYLFVLGSGLGASSKLGSGYRGYIYPGTLALSMLMSATFAAISIVFDRQIGFFKAILVAPVPRSAIAFGKIGAGAAQALMQGIVLLPFCLAAGLTLGWMGALTLVGALVLAAVTFSTLGVAIACRFNSTTVFPIVSNAVLLPMFFLSGGLYPLATAPQWMRIAAHFDPVAYAVDLMRGAFGVPHFFPVWLSVGAQVLTVIVLGASAVSVFSRGEDDSSLGESTLASWRRR